MVEIPHTHTQFFKSKNQQKSMKRETVTQDTHESNPNLTQQNFQYPKRKIAFARNGLVKIAKIKHY